VLAVHEVSSHSIDVDPATGAIAYSGDGILDDPLAGETFDTPEFAQSAEGHAQASGRDDTV
jgi:choline/glycine/proline betaine transport protein